MIQTEERARGGPRGSGSDGTGSHVGGAPGPAGVLHWFRTLALPLLVLALAIVGTLGYLYWFDQTFYVTTDNAHVTGAMAHVASPASGLVRSVWVEVGELVARGQVVATVATAAGTSPLQLQLRAPLDGVVVAVDAVPGDIAAAGRPIVSVVDPASMYVLARINETQVGRLYPGQFADVWVDSLGMSLPGRVSAVGSASVSAVSQAPPTNPTGFFVKVPQSVPVKIDLSEGGHRLVAGGSAVVRIRVQE